MRLLLCCLLYALPAAGAEPKIAPFHLYAAFQHVPADSVLSALRGELDSLMAPIGWEIAWTSVQDATRARPAALATVQFKGDCGVNSAAQKLVFQRPLGESYVDKGEMLPFSTVYCDAIHSFLASPLKSSDRRNADYLFGRALGRVVAHELYHVLTGERRHAGQGLAQEHLTPEELLSSTLRFQSEEVHKLRLKLVPILFDFYRDAIGRDERAGYRTYILAGCSGCHGTSAQGTSWGPPLRGTGRTYDSTTVQLWLNNRRSEMYRRARTLQLLWPSLKPGEMEGLIEYLNALDRSPIHSALVAR